MSTYLVQIRIRAQKSERTVQGKSNEVSEFRKQLESINEKYHQVTLALSSQQDENKRLADENAGLKAHLAALRQAQKESLGSSPDVVDLRSRDNSQEPMKFLPDWMKDWRSSRTYDRTSLAVLIMEDTGKALRPSITKMMVRKL